MPIYTLKGDSGSPLMFKDNSGQFVIVGVVSNGVPCIEPKDLPSAQFPRKPGSRE